MLLISRFWTWAKRRRAFFEGRARHPRFKSKKRSKPSFYLANDQFELGDHRIWIPKLGWVNMAENLRFKGKVMGARITKTADWWFVSIQVELPDAVPVNNPEACGIDVGLNRLATLPYGRGSREPSLPQDRPQETSSGQQTTASQKAWIKQSGESPQTGGPPALPHHLYAR
jgi:transposase